VLLSPFYLLSEYVIRKPLDALFGFLESHDRLNALYDFFAFGPDHKIGFAPIGFVEFGFLPSFGVYGFWNDALVRNNAFHVHVEAWPTDWVAASFTDRYTFGDSHFVELRAAGVNRPDQVFYGIGPGSLESDRSRFREARTDLSATVDLHLWRSSRVRTWGGLRKVDLSDGHYGSDPSLSTEAATRAFPIPFGFDRGYLDPYGAIGAAFDTRSAAAPGSGIRLEAEGDLGTDVMHGSAGWAHWGGAASVFIELGQPRRVLSLSAAAMFADPLGSDPSPFTELVSLGGDKWMTGYFPGRLRGRSAAVGMLRYDWPIASWIDGTLQAAFGNVFDAHLDGLRPGLLRFSGALGITTTSEIVAAFAGAGNVPSGHQRAAPVGPKLEFVAGFGTETFEQGAAVKSFHVAFGIPHSL
jgi:hypothetical protein